MEAAMGLADMAGELVGSKLAHRTLQGILRLVDYPFTAHDVVVNVSWSSFSSSCFAVFLSQPDIEGRFRCWVNVIQ